MKQAIVDKNHAVSSAALVSSLVIKFDIVITLNFNFLSIILKGEITQISNNCQSVLDYQYLNSFDSILAKAVLRWSSGG